MPKSTEKRDIKTLSLNQLIDVLESMGEKKFRAKQIYEWLWKKHVTSFDEMLNISSSLRNSLSEFFYLNNLNIAYEQRSSDGTIKVGFELIDKELVEGVLIPAENRSTACISTQVGCAMRCAFCATAQLGFKRNLSVSEIYDQVILINKKSLNIYNRGLSNIVIMGMGEPLLNYENVMTAIGLMTSNDGLSMSPSRITLSTVGLPKMIRQLADDEAKFNLAISLHASTDEKRNVLIPANIHNSLTDISDALVYYNKKTGERVTIEYLLLCDVNDGLEDAANLAKFCKRFPVKINLIEFNKVDNLPYNSSNPIKTESFKNFLEQKNMIVNIRHSRGKDIDAACGQLANKNLNDNIKTF